MEEDGWMQMEILFRDEAMREITNQLVSLDKDQTAVKMITAITLEYYRTI